MMRSLVVALTFCLAGVLADDGYVPGIWQNPAAPNDYKGIGGINYYIKHPASAKPEGGPILYGIAGRVPVEDIKSQYDLFDNVGFNFFNATVVYVEQRFFGRSKTAPIKKVSDLTSLTLDNVVDDHVSLIQKLAADYNTRNILVFGGGHGGVIAGYVANKFTTGDLAKNYSVLGWSSSPPTKYLRHIITDNSKLQDIGKQILALMMLDPPTGKTCADVDALKLPLVFQKIKDWFGDANAATNGYTDSRQLRLDPLPTIKAATGDPPSDDQKQLVTFLRKSIIDLSYEPVYGADGKKIARKLPALCQIVKPLTAATINSDVINSILALFGASDDTIKLRWKVTNDGSGVLNQDLVASTYQDCTDYKIAYCASSSDPASPNGDPLTASQYSLYHTAAASPTCTTIDNYAADLAAECTGLLGPDFKPTTDLSKDKYPGVLNTQVVTTINSKSVFGKGSMYADVDKNTTSYGFFYNLERTDNWEFQAPRGCDSALVKDVRYLILRAFGCLGNFVTSKDPKVAACDPKTLFEAGNNADDASFPDTCAVDTTSKFPFGQTPDIDFVPPYHSTVAPVVTTTTLPPKTVISTTSTQAPTTSDGNNFLPSAIILASSAMLAWFTTL